MFQSPAIQTTLFAIYIPSHSEPGVIARSIRSTASAPPTTATTGSKSTRGLLYMARVSCRAGVTFRNAEPVTTYLCQQIFASCDNGSNRQKIDILLRCPNGNIVQILAMPNLIFEALPTSHSFPGCALSLRKIPNAMLQPK